MRKASIIFIFVVLVLLPWVYFGTGTPPSGPKLTLKNVPVKSIGLSWAGTNQSIFASDQCAKVIETMLKARRSPIPASPPFGFLTLCFIDGTTNIFYLQPSGRFAAMELVGDSGGYAISMGAMLDTFQSVGLLAKNPR